ncbi:MAG: MarR family transcriptional regulator [Oscillospiraceae bacterium]|nr:MarR family transcriptional regulator [Oscillospiraceae bacterium]
MTLNIFENTYRFVNKYNQKTQKPKRYGTDDLLYAAEVHMIDTIGTHGEITTTSLAQLLGITKGAVSQTTAKLLDKGLIEKQTSPEKKTAICIRLSEKGQLVFDYHRDMHRNAQEKVQKLINTLSPESLAAVQGIIDALDEMLDEI